MDGSESFWWSTLAGCFSRKTKCLSPQNIDHTMEREDRSGPLSSVIWKTSCWWWGRVYAVKWSISIHRICPYRTRDLCRGYQMMLCAPELEKWRNASKRWYSLTLPDRSRVSDRRKGCNLLYWAYCLCFPMSTEEEIVLTNLIFYIHYIY